MQNIHTLGRDIRKTLWLALLCVCLVASGALADGVMPKMPEPPKTPVYWQLVSIEHTPQLTPAGGLNVEYEVIGLTPDLNDRLLTESLLMEEDATQGISLTFTRKGEPVVQQTYQWNPLPIYMVPNTTYTIDVQGTQTEGEGSTPNSLLSLYVLGDRIGRISAGGYTGHADSFSFDIGPDVGLYQDGSLVVGFTVRDVNDLFTDHIVYTYEMIDGVRPVPTPIPGFVPVDLPDDLVVPPHYVPVEGQDGLWQVITAPEEYRAYGSMSGSEPSFFPADPYGHVVMDEKPADPEADFDAHVKGFVAETPDAVPPQYTDQGDGTYSFITRDGETQTRVYGRVDGGEAAFYPAEEDGTVASDAAATTPDADFDAHVRGFGSATPGELPAHYEIIGEGLYAFRARDGQTYYRVYGRLHGEEPAFYPADETGNVAEDAQAVQPQDDFDTHIKGFDATPLERELPAHYYIVEEELYAVDDREGQPVYRVFGIKDGQPTAFYPADEQGNVAEDATPVDPQADYEAHVKGFVPAQPNEAPEYYEATEVPGVYGFIDKDGNPHYRAYGSLHRGEAAFYPSDAEGTVANDALPVQPASDLAIMPPPPFVPALPDTAFMPTHYEVVQDAEGLYTFKGFDGEPVYRVYGAFGKGEAGFYPADDEGNAVQGGMAVNPEDEYQTHFAGFVPAQPEQIPDRYTAVEGKEGLYTFLDKELEPVYRVYGAVEDGTPAFYPADAQGNVLSGEPADPAADALQMSMAAVNVVATIAPKPTAENTSIARSAHGNSWTDLLVTYLPEAANTIAPTAGPAATAQSISRGMSAPPESLPDAMQQGVTASVTQGSAGADGTPQTVTRVVDQTALPTETDGADATAVPENLPDAMQQGVIASVTQGSAGADGTPQTVTRVVDETALPTETDGSDTTAMPEDTAGTVTTESPETAAPEVTEAPQETVAPTAEPTPVPEQSTGLSTPIWVLIIVGGAAVIGGGAYAITRRKGKG